MVIISAKTSIIYLLSLSIISASAKYEYEPEQKENAKEDGSVESLAPLSLTNRESDDRYNIVLRCNISQPTWSFTKFSNRRSVRLVSNSSEMLILDENVTNQNNISLLKAQEPGEYKCRGAGLITIFYVKKEAGSGLTFTSKTVELKDGVNNFIQSQELKSQTESDVFEDLKKGRSGTAAALTNSAEIGDGTNNSKNSKMGETLSEASQQEQPQNNGDVANGAEKSSTKTGDGKAQPKEKRLMQGSFATVTIGLLILVFIIAMVTTRIGLPKLLNPESDEEQTHCLGGTDHDHHEVNDWLNSRSSEVDVATV